MDAMYFRCDGCGKCCTSPPTFLVGDFLKYSNDFVFAFRLKNLLESTFTVDPLMADVFNHNTAIFHTQPTSQSDIVRRTIFFPYGINLPSERRCPMVSDQGKCAIYERRPPKCKSVPFQAVMPSSIQFSKHLEANHRMMLDHGCLASSAQDGYIKIHENGKITSDRFSESIKIEVDDLIANKINARDFMEFRGKMTSDEMDINPIIYLLYLFKKGDVDWDVLTQYAHAQNRLIARMVDQALSKKDKGDRSFVKMIKTFKDMNNVILASPKLVHPIPLLEIGRT